MEVGLLTLTKGERLSYGKLLLIMKDGRRPFCSDIRRKAVFCYLFEYLKDGISSFFHQKLMKYELQLQMNFRSAFGELKRQTKDNVSCSDTSFLYFEVENLMKR